MALNLSEMETKVREATNNEPWGCPTTLMAQIAAGTYNYREREEILSFIFRRFTEKAANEWRQIYKSLQLLDYLVKHGSERIIDDIRANISLIQMLKSFHYIDSKGRDQGINVRNRSKNLVNLLNDDALVRLERKKARANSKKFGNGAAHTSSDTYSGSGSGYSGSYGGGADEDFTNRVYGDGGVFGARYDDPADAYKNGATGGDNNFEEYDVEPASSSRTSQPTVGSSNAQAGSSSSAAKSKPQPVVPEKDLLADLLDFDASQSAAPVAASQSAPQDDDDDDDFDDFQSAPSLATNTASVTNNLANLYVSQPATSLQPHYELPSQIQQQPRYPVNSGVSAGPAKASGDAFSSLFTSAKSRSTNAPRQPIVSKPTKTNDDDLFSDFTSNRSGQNSTQVSNQVQNNSGEVDLLSF